MSEELCATCMGPAPDRFKVVGGRGFFRPTGRMSLAEAGARVDGALAYYTGAQGIKELLVNGNLGHWLRTAQPSPWGVTYVNPADDPRKQ